MGENNHVSRSFDHKCLFTLPVFGYSYGSIYMIFNKELNDSKVNLIS